MPRKSLAGDVCPVARGLEAVGDAWSVLIVREAFVGRRRFGEFQAALGVAKNILTVRLRKLVALGVLDRVPPADGGGHHEYTLTDRGRALHLVLAAIRQWGEDGACARPPYVLVDRRDRKPVRRLALQSHDGRELGPGDVEMVPARSRAG